MSFESIETPDLGIDERGLSRTLLQFRQSEVFLYVLEALNSEAKALIEATQDVIHLRGAADAADENLDAIGRIVGQERELVDYSTLDWFTPDMEFEGADQGLAWISGVPTGDTLIADDVFYRQLIEGKVYRNFITTGSVPEIQNVINIIAGIDSSVLPSGDLMTVVVVVPDGTSQNVIDFLERFKDTPEADYVYYLPIPSTVRIAQVLRYSDYTP